MAILGNKKNLIEDEQEKKSSYTIPAVIKEGDEKFSLKKSIVISAILHPTILGVTWLIVFLLALMGITFSVFDRPKPKINDIEFVLVDNLKEQTPLNKKTPFRSDRNTRTGGKRDFKKKVSMPSPTPAKKSIQQQATPAHKPTPKPKITQNNNIFNKMKNITKSVTKNAPEAKPQPPSARPSLKPPSVPRPSMKPVSPFSVPVPKPTGTKIGKTYSTGPIGGSGRAVSGGSNGGGHAPVPSLAPTSGGSGGSTGSKLSKGGSGYGNMGNPGGGGGAPGIDSIREPDFGPYMRELQRRIKMNWDPPKGNESKRVVLLFKIAKDGRLLSLKVFKSSGIPSADKAALSAVELTAPFRPLPGDFRSSSIDIQFTFDYNVFGASGYN